MASVRESIPQADISSIIRRHRLRVMLAITFWIGSSVVSMLLAASLCNIRVRD